MLTAKIKELISKLREKTRKDEAVWEKTSREDEFMLKLDSGAIAVDKWSDNTENNVDFSIYNENGDLIDRVLADDLNNLEEYNLINNFHSDIRRAYYKADQTIDGIFNELNKEGKIGKSNNVDDFPF